MFIPQKRKMKIENNKLLPTDLKAFLFDMDGVLYDSMPKHAKAWVHSFQSLGLEFNEYEAYMREGMTGSSTINDIFGRQLNRTASEEECQRIYAEKAAYFERLGTSSIISGVDTVLQLIRQNNISIFLVTGSGQKSLLDKLEHSFPGVFQKERMVTAYDVKKGKPDPEPYLMALQKGGLNPNQAIVIENAPLGVKSAVAAGIFTIAVNTGILRDEELLNSGANLLYHSMEELLIDLPKILSNSFVDI